MTLILIVSMPVACCILAIESCLDIYPDYTWFGDFVRVFPCDLNLYWPIGDAGSRDETDPELNY